jgi:hypothetical protein
MPGVQFPFSSLSEEERLTGISGQIGEALMISSCSRHSIPRLLFCFSYAISLCRAQRTHVPASRACSRLAELICFSAKVESRAVLNVVLFIWPVTTMQLR